MLSEWSSVYSISENAAFCFFRDFLTLFTRLQEWILEKSCQMSFKIKSSLTKNPIYLVG